MRWRFRLEERQENREASIKQLESKAEGRRWLQEAREVGAHIAERDGWTGVRTHAVFHDMHWTVTEFGTITREYFTKGNVFGFPILPERKDIQVLRSPGLEVAYQLPFAGRTVRWEFGKTSKLFVRKGKYPFRRKLPTSVVVSFG